MTREEVYADWLLGEALRACEKHRAYLRVWPPFDDDQNWQAVAFEDHTDNTVALANAPTLGMALAELLADMSNPPPPLPSAEEVREARSALWYSPMTKAPLGPRAAIERLRILAASDDLADRLMARLIVEVGDA